MEAFLAMNTGVSRLILLAILLLCAIAGTAAERSFSTWSQYLGGADSSQYSSLRQINKSNVKQLEIAWTHPNTGAVGTRGMNYWESKDRSDRRLFYINAGFLTAIDARTGKTVNSFGDSRRWVRPGRSEAVAAKIRPPAVTAGSGRPARTSQQSSGERVYSVRIVENVIRSIRPIDCR